VVERVTADHQVLRSNRSGRFSRPGNILVAFILIAIEIISTHSQHLQVLATRFSADFGKDGSGTEISYRNSVEISVANQNIDFDKISIGLE
jgi:hypothetical protein